MNENMQKQEKPRWVQGRYVDEQKFCQDFLSWHPLTCQDGIFFSREGRLREDTVRYLIYQMLSEHVRSGVAAKVNSLLELLKLEASKVPLPRRETVIHCANGTFNTMEMSMSSHKELCRCRLPVAYNPQAPRPALWEAFLEELLEPGDILTLQEFLGYCLLPINYGQKMMVIIGSGGEGKSRIGIVLRALLGEGMCNGSLAKVEASPFARADLQHRLVMVDDDLRMAGLNTTNYIKSIVTAEQPMDLEKKGKQSYQGELFCRFLAFGNGNLRSLHDRSHGFFRRQIILTTKPRRKDRVDDPYLSSRLRDELEGILQWCIVGLERLLNNDMQFTITDRTRQNMENAVAEGNNVPSFLQSQGYVRFDAQGEISSRHLYSLYRDWCEDNMLQSIHPKSFSSWLIQQAGEYGLEYSTNIPDGNARHVRGFRGIRGCSRF